METTSYRGPRTKYSNEFKEDVVRRIRDGEFHSCYHAAKMLGLQDSLVQKWARDRGVVAGTIVLVKETPMQGKKDLRIVEPVPKSFRNEKEKAEYFMLRAYYLEELFKLSDLDEEVKKKSPHAVGAAGERADGERGHISLLTRIAGISRKTYYAHRQKTPAELRKEKTVSLMRDIQERNNHSLGVLAMQDALALKGVRLSHNTVDKLMSENDLHAVVRLRKFPPAYYRSMKEAMRNLPKNLLDRQFDVKAPGKVYVTDITYIPVSGGWLYLSVLKDLYNCEIVSWALSRHCDALLCVETVDRLAAKRNLGGAMIHSDRGATYTSRVYRTRLKELGVVQSMSRKGECHDNACVESFFAVLKTCCFAQDRRELKLHMLPAMDVYFRIDSWMDQYNITRGQRRLGWLSPVYYRILFPNGRLPALPDNHCRETA